MIDQMELGFGARSPRSRRLAHRQARRQRAQWWFARMRQAVDTAIDWSTTPPARPQQSYLSLHKK